MAEVEISSAVAPLDSPAEPSSPSKTLKRRRSDDVEEQGENDGGKRQRLNGDSNDTVSPSANDATSVNNHITTQDPRLHASANQAHDTPQSNEEPSTPPKRQPPAPDRRKPNIADEKQRSKRLFGALLGNLSRPADTKQSNRRAEIEARRKSEIQKQDEETAAQDARKREERQAWRRRRQGDVDEQQMRIRHTNELEKARFLFTETEPRIYWKPWELRADEEERIEAQVSEAEDRVEREKEDFYRKRDETRGEDGRRDNGVESPQAVPLNGRHEPTENGKHDRSDEATTRENTRDGQHEVLDQLHSNDSEETTGDVQTAQDSSTGTKSLAVDDDHTNVVTLPTDEPVSTEQARVDQTEHEPDPELEADGGGEGEEDTVIY